MFTAPASRRLFSVVAVATCALGFSRSAASLPFSDAATSEVAALQSSPPAPRFGQYLREPTSSTISMDQWDVPTHQVEWEDRAFETTTSLKREQWDLKKRPRHLNLKPAVYPEFSIMSYIRQKTRRGYFWARSYTYRAYRYLTE